MGMDALYTNPAVPGLIAVPHSFLQNNAIAALPGDVFSFLDQLTRLYVVGAGLVFVLVWCLL